MQALPQGGRLGARPRRGPACLHPEGPPPWTPPWPPRPAAWPPGHGCHGSACLEAPRIGPAGGRRWSQASGSLGPCRPCPASTRGRVTPRRVAACAPGRGEPAGSHGAMAWRTARHGPDVTAPACAQGMPRHAGVFWSGTQAEPSGAACSPTRRPTPPRTMAALRAPRIHPDVPVPSRRATGGVFWSAKGAKITRP